MKKLLIQSTLFAATVGGCGLAGAMTADAAAGSRQPAAMQCEQPAIPAYSTSTEGLRRVQKSVDAWQTCANDYLGQDDSDDAYAAVMQVAEAIYARRAGWIVATARYNNGQAAGRLVQTLGERDWIASIARSRANYASQRYVAPRPDNARLITVVATE